jgi:hypothetical protein
MRRETIFLWKVVFGSAAVIIAIGLLFFNFDTIVMWMTLNDPFQGQWAVVQLSDGEILYGHLAGVTVSTIGLDDVYLLDKVTPEATSTETQIPTPAVSSTTTSSSTGLSVVGALAPVPGASAALIPVSDTPQLFINRASVLYFKYVTPDDPALLYLH